MRDIITFSLFFLLGFYLFGEVYFAVSIGISGYLFSRIILESTRVFVFREWALMLYALNYLLAPTITYQLDQALLAYPMKIAAADYYEIAIPGFLCFYAGMHLLRTRIFTPRLEQVKRDVENNISILVSFALIGLILRLVSSVFPGELFFFIYLLSTIRFVGVYALFAYDSKKYWKWVAVLLIIEFYIALTGAMFHDAVMWILFFALFLSYTTKPTLSIRLIGLCFCIVFVLFIQGLKGEYRSNIVEGGNTDLSSVLQSSSDMTENIGSEDNLLGSLNRGNQAWIFASTKERMDRIGDYQGLHILGIYLEAALLPRFLAPDKLISGDKKIFNAYSGHQINQNTAMGLGVFADGYIAYGYWGVMFFTFGLGLLFNFTFRIVESWAKLSEFYVLMILPLLNYAVRPDCELQTTINHLAKGLLVFGILVTLTKFNFQFNAGAHKSSKLKRAALPDLSRIHN